MSETYRVVVDSDLDGWAHLWSDPTAYTTPNLITNRRLTIGATSGAAATVQGANTRYGLERWFVNLPSSGTWVELDTGFVPGSTGFLKFTYWDELLSGSYNFQIYQGATFRGALSVLSGTGVTRRTLRVNVAAGTEITFRIRRALSNGGAFLEGFMITDDAFAYPDEFWVHDPNDDIITDDVVSIEWNRGFEGTAQPVAVVGTGELVLDGWNSYMPGWANNSPITIGASLITARQNMSDWDVISKLEVLGIDHQKGDLHSDRVRVRLTDAARLWYEAPYYDALLLDADQHDLLREIADQIGNPPAPFYERVFYDQSSTIDSDSGSTKVAYLSDNVDDGDFIAPILRELGWMTIQRCWITREGLMSGWAHPKTVTSTATIDDSTDIVDGSWSHANEMFNYVNLPLQVRRQDTNTRVVDNAAEEFLMSGPNGSQFVFNVRYRVSQDWLQVYGVTAIDGPDGVGLGQNYWGFEFRNNAGINYTANLSVSWVNRGTMLEVIVNKNTAADVYLRLQVDGTALVRGQPFNIVETDNVSIQQYGVRALHRQIPYFDDLRDVETASNWLISTYGVPRSGYDMIAFDQTKNLSYAWEWDIYTRIAIQNNLASSPADASLDYIITSEYQRIDMGSGRHRVEYGLERYFEAT